MTVAEIFAERHGPYGWHCEGGAIYWSSSNGYTLSFDEIATLANAAWEQHKMSEQIPPEFCDHANEVPAQCYCPPNCYCRTHTCKLLTRSDCHKASKPTEKRERYRVDEYGDTIRVIKDTRLVSLYYSFHPDARAAAEAECARLNEAVKVAEPDLPERPWRYVGGTGSHRVEAADSFVVMEETFRDYHSQKAKDTARRGAMHIVRCVNAHDRAVELAEHVLNPVVGDAELRLLARDFLDAAKGGES